MKYFNNKQQAYKQNKVLNRRDADNLIVASHKLFMMIGCLSLNQCYIQPNYWVLPKVFQFPADDEVEA